MLDALGLDADQEAVYRCLVRAGEGAVGDLVDRTGLPLQVVNDAVIRLEQKGLAHRESERILAYRPELAIEAALGDLEAAVGRARATTRSLAEEYRADLPPLQNLDVVQMIEGRDALIDRHRQLHLSAAQELLTFERPPYVSDPLTPNQEEQAQLARGVRVRGIYARASIEFPGRLVHIMGEVAAGEEARVVPEVPLKMVIADRRAALVPLTNAGTVDHGLLLGPCSLLDALVELFESLWLRALPLVAGDEGGVDHDSVDRVILSLLAAGLSDDAIARQLQISVRTVRRRVARLLTVLDARTRFQAAVHASQQGLL